MASKNVRLTVIAENMLNKIPPPKRESKPLILPRPNQKKNPRRDQAGYVGISDGKPRPAEAFRNGLLQIFPFLQFFFHPFKYQDVGVHRHADGQDKYGDAGRRQGNRYEFEQSQNYYGVKTERQNGRQARQSVPQYKKQRHQNHPVNSGHYTLGQKFFSQSRPDALLGNKADWHGQSARVESLHQKFGLLGSELAGDLSFSAGNFFSDVRNAYRRAVQKYGD